LKLKLVPIIAFLLILMATAFPITYYEIISNTAPPPSYWRIDSLLIGTYNFKEGTVILSHKKVTFVSNSKTLSPSDIFRSARVVRFGSFSHAQKEGNTLYILSKGQVLHKLTIEGDTFNWETYNIPISRVENFSIKGNYIAARTREKVYLLKLKGKSILKVWEANIGIPLKGIPVLDSKNTLYTRDKYGRVFAVQNGEVRAEFKLGRHLSNFVTTNGKVGICTSRGLFVLDTDTLPKVIVASDLPFYTYKSLKLKHFKGYYWCSSQDGVIAWDEAGHLITSARLEPQRPYYSFFPAYDLRYKIRSKLQAQKIPVKFFGPFIYLLSSHQDIFPSEEGATYIRVDNWELSYYYQNLRGRSRLTVNNKKGVLIAARVLPTGFSSFNSQVLYSINEYSYTGSMYNLLLNPLFNNTELIDARIWKGLYSRDNVKFIKIGSNIFLSFYSYPRGTIIIPIYTNF